MSPFELLKRRHRRELQEIAADLDELEQQCQLQNLVRSGTDLSDADRARIRSFVALLPKPKRPNRGTIRTTIDNTKGLIMRLWYIKRTDSPADHGVASFSGSYRGFIICATYESEVWEFLDTVGWGAHKPGPYKTLLDVLGTAYEGCEKGIIMADFCAV